MSFARETAESAAKTASQDRFHFFEGAVHGEALARLEHLVEGGARCSIVVGPRGTGKSTVLQVFVQECREIGCEAVSVDVTGLDGGQLMQTLAQRLQVTSRARGRLSTLWTEVSDALGGRALAAHPCVIVIDHLDRAQPEGQRLVRRLLQQDQRNQATIWVLGFSGRQFPLVPRDWRERSDLRIEVGPLSDAESHEFLESLCEFCNRPRDAFAATADALIDVTRGVPADLRRLAELSLLLEGDSHPHVSPGAVAAAVEELRGLRCSA